MHANYLGVTSDSHGQYVWVLRNFADDSGVKSKKEQLQIACKERQYNVVSRHEFRGMDASGDVISSVNLRKQGRYQWLPMKPDIDGLFSVVCKGQLKRPPSQDRKARRPEITSGAAGNSATCLTIPSGWR